MSREGLHREIVGSRLSWGLAGDEATPGFVALVDDLSGVLLVLGFAGEREGVFGFAVGDLVNPATDEGQ